MSIQPILIELPVVPVEPEPAPDPAALAFSQRLAILRGEVEPPDSDILVCVYCGESSGRLVESDAVGGFIHEACWPAFREHPEVKAMQAQQAAEIEAKDENYSRWVREGEILGGRRKTFIAGFNDLPFQIGDWLVKGEDGGFRVPQGLYKVAEQLTGYKNKSLRDFASVSRRVPLSIRYRQLPWAAHQVVASLKTEAHRKEALELAVAKGWKVRDIRKALANVKPEYKDPTPQELKDGQREKTLVLWKRFERWVDSLYVPENEFSEMVGCAVPKTRQYAAGRLRETAAKLLEYAAKLEEEQLAQQAEVTAAAV